MQVAGLIGVIAMFPVLYNALAARRDRQRWFWSKTGETAIAVACVALAGFVFNWHLLVLSLKY